MGVPCVGQDREPCYLIPSRVACLLLLMTQGGILDYFLVKYHNKYWYTWIAGDVAIFFVFLVAFIISYRHLQLVRLSAKTTPIEPGSLPMVYFAWFIYAAILAVRVTLIFKNEAWLWDNSEVFSPNTLQITVSMSALVFMLLLLTHYSAAPWSKRRQQINLLTCTVVFDIFDAVDLLSVFFHQETKDSLLPGLEWAILGVVCLNLALPTLPLATLNHTHFGQKRLSRHLETAHKLMLLFAVNIPMLCLRLVLWFKHAQVVSAFLTKDVVMIFVILYDFYDRDHHWEAEVSWERPPRRSFEVLQSEEVTCCIDKV